MKYKLTAFVLACSVVTASHAFGLGDLTGSKPSATAGADVGTQVETFNKTAGLISQAMTFALNQIIVALGTKEQIAIAKANAEGLLKVTDPGERNSQAGKSLVTGVGLLTQTMAESSAKEKMANLSPEMKKQVAASMFAVGVSALQIPGAMDLGKQIMSSASANPMNLSKVLPVKTGLSTFADILPTLPALVKNGSAMMREAKIEAPDPTFSAKIGPSTDQQSADLFKAIEH